MNNACVSCWSPGASARLPALLGGLLLVWLTLAAPVWASRWPESLPERLERQPVRSARPLEEVIRAQGQRWTGSSEIFLLELRDGTMGVFRSEDEPWGSQAEVAGFRVTQWLGLEVVPPTVTRTLTRGEWPAGSRWPYPVDSRTGSLQLYVKSRPITAEEYRAMDPLVRADTEVVSFVMGRYDNHDGNLLIDEMGQPFLVDFENCLEIQKARYGEVAYVRRGVPRKDLASLSVLQSFPFDQPETLRAPTLEQIQERFSPWWTIWPQGMQHLYKVSQNLDDRTVRYVIWDHRLWVQARASSRHACYTAVYRPETMKKLAQLDSLALQPLLPPPFTPEHTTGMLERAAQALAAWRAGG